MMYRSESPLVNMNTCYQQPESHCVLHIRCCTIIGCQHMSSTEKVSDNEMLKGVHNAVIITTLYVISHASCILIAFSDVSGVSSDVVWYFKHSHNVIECFIYESGYDSPYHIISQTNMYDVLRVAFFCQFFKCCPESLHYVPHML